MKIFTRLLAGAMMIAPVAATSTASAIASYNNSDAFAAAAGPVTTIDFQGCKSVTGAFAVDGTLGGSGACSGLPSGIDFAPPAGGSLYVADPLQSSNPSIALGLDEPNGGAISFTLATFSTSFGAQFYQNFGGGDQSDGASSYKLTFFNDDTPAATWFVGVRAGGTFFGLIGLDPYNRVAISQQTAYAVIDNVSFGGIADVVTAAPEPATWALMLVGFGAAGLAMRRAPRRAGKAMAA